MVPPASSPTAKTSASATRHRKIIEEILFTSGLGDRVSHFFASFSAQLARSSDEVMATTNFLRFLEASFNRTTLLRDLDDHPILLETLFLIFGSSQYFADVLIRDPELFRWLTATEILETPRSREDYSSLARQATDPLRTVGRKLNTLKRFHRREMLRIGVRDLLGLASLEGTTLELSNLADIVVGATAELVVNEMGEQYGARPETRWAIVGLGKLGGEELNYSSDIDLIALFDDDGEFTTGAGVKMTYGEFYVRFVERVVETLSHPTEEGYFYRVDLRLRPDGKSGALIRSFASTMLYYESRGELWERQMLIKARGVAGNGELGSKFLNAISPFVYRRTFFENPAEEISRIKSRIESEAGEHNIKLQAGGIRDIEFIVQALQLINGGRTPSIRTGNTLAAIGLLSTNGLLSAPEASELREAYLFLRNLEHRLQMQEYAQTHSLPVTKRERTRVAARLGLTLEQLEGFLKLHRRNVRRIFDSVFTRQARVQTSLDRFLAERPDSEFVRSYAAKYRLTKVEKATHALRRLMYGTTLLGRKEYPERTRELFRKISEPLLAEAAGSVSPDTALTRCERILSSFPSPDTMYALCAEGSFRKVFVTLCAESGLLANRFALSPDLAETILTGIDPLLGESTATMPPSQGLFRWKEREETKAIVRYLLSHRSEELLFRSLSVLATLTLAAVEKRARTALKLPASARFALLGLGKLGGEEIGVGSDLDVLFLFEAKKKSEGERYERLSARIMSDCSQAVGSGKLYDVDARLRPEGRNAPLAVAGEQYLEYLHHRASLWERQSLTRARFVAGNRDFAEGMLGQIHEIVYRTPLPRDWSREIVSMRKRTEGRSRISSANYYDIKLGSGGMMDAEFAIQAIQLARGRSAHPSTNMYQLLDAYSEDPQVGRQVATLKKHYGFYRKVEASLQIGLNAKSHVIPSDEEALDYLSRLLKFASAAQFTTALRSALGETRKAFESVLASSA
ncbi:MAG TPA: hypothetical protein VMG34_09075 [Bacteroidota bacterium]|nr:hypothetical protein [Bacteroidota bacterium]